MTATTAPMHAHRTSEGQQTVERLFRNAHIVLPYPTTELALQLQETQRHTELAHAKKVLAPRSRTNEPQQHPADAGQGRGLDHLYQGRTFSDRMRRAIVAEPHEHTEPEKTGNEHQPQATRRVLVAYVLFLLACVSAAHLVATWLAFGGF